MTAALFLAATLAAAPAAAEQGVTSYPASFFAQFQPNTAWDMLGHVPGFTVDLGSAVRGFIGSSGNVLVDGERPAEKTETLDEMMKRIPVSSVLRIDVIRGGAPGVDMQGKTVVANIVRRHDSQGRASLAVSDDFTVHRGAVPGLRADASRTLGKVRLDASIVAGEGFDDGTGDGPRVVRDGTGALVGRGLLRSSGLADVYKITFGAEGPVAGGKLRLDTDLSSNLYDYLEHDDFATLGQGYQHIHQRQDSAEAGLRYDRDVGSKLKLEAYALENLGNASVAQDQTDSGVAVDIFQSGDVSQFRVFKRTAESIGRITLTWQPSPRLTVESGGEADYNWLKDHTTYVQDGQAIALPAADVVVTEERVDGFVSATWQARPDLSVEASMRGEASRIASTGDVVQAKTLVYPKPRAVLTFSPDKADQIRLRVEREVGQLNFDDFAATGATFGSGGPHVGNPELRPQTDWVIEAAFDHRFWNGGDLTATFRKYWLSDVIDRIPVLSPAGDFDAPGNIGSGSQEEAALALTLPLDRLGVAQGALTGSATWRWSRVIDPTTLTPRPITGLHPSDMDLHFTQGLPRWKTTWGFDIGVAGGGAGPWRQTTWRFNEIDIDKLKTWTDVFAEFRLRPDLSIRFELDDAGARSFEHGRQLYAGPRNVFPLEYTDISNLHFAREYYVRIRKTFG